MSIKLTRRALMALGVTGAASAAFPQAALGAVLDASGAELEALRRSWREGLTAGLAPRDHAAVVMACERLDRTAGEHLRLLAANPTKAEVFSDLPLARQDGTVHAANIAASHARLAAIALAWATPGVASHANPASVSVLVEGLRLLADAGYREGERPVGNWWLWEIGIPASLTTLLTLAYSIVPSADRARYLAAVRHFAPNPNFRSRGASFAETGANRADKAFACALRGILDGRPDEIVLARDAMSDAVGGGHNSLFRYVEKGDGFYADGSFIQHDKLPYAGSYGNVAVAGVARMMILLAGSRWAIADPDRDVVFDAMDRTFAPFMRSGRMMETVRGRAVSRGRERDYHSGFACAGNALLLASAAPERAAHHRSLAKGWMSRCSERYVEHGSVPQVVDALAVLQDANVVVAPESRGHRHFPGQERSVHHREGWAFTVSISSSRIGRYEWGNRENNEGWYQGDGMAYLHLDADQGHYADEFWPTHDPYRLPGTTCGDEVRSNGAVDGTGIPEAYRSFAGGLALDGRFGIIAMDHENHDHSVVGRKAWFCVDDAIVALGAGIAGNAGRAVATTIEHRNLGSTPGRAILADGQAVVPQVGDHWNATDAGWFHVEGVAGYLLLQPGKIALRREARRGTWRRINSGGDTGGVDAARERTYATLVLEHGVDPAGASYAYAILPTATATATARRAADPGLQVACNDASAQVMNFPAERLTLAVLYVAGATPQVETDGACCVAFRRIGKQTRISVSAPARQGGLLRIRLPQVSARSVVEAEDGIGLSGTGRSIAIEVNLDGLAGGPRRIVVTD